MKNLSRFLRINNKYEKINENERNTKERGSADKQENMRLNSVNSRT